MLLEERTMSNVSLVSTALSLRMEMSMQRIGLPTLSPGKNVNDVFKEEKSRPAECGKKKYLS